MPWICSHEWECDIFGAEETMLRHYLANLTSLIARALTLGFGKKKCGQMLSVPALAYCERERARESLNRTGNMRPSSLLMVGGWSKDTSPPIFYSVHIYIDLVELWAQLPAPIDVHRFCPLCWSNRYLSCPFVVLSVYQATQQCHLVFQFFHEHTIRHAKWKRPIIIGGFDSKDITEPSRAKSFPVNHRRSQIRWFGFLSSNMEKNIFILLDLCFGMVFLPLLCLKE